MLANDRRIIVLGALLLAACAVSACGRRALAFDAGGDAPGESATGDTFARDGSFVRDESPSDRSAPDAPSAPDGPSGLDRPSAPDGPSGLDANPDRGGDLDAPADLAEARADLPGLPEAGSEAGDDRGVSPLMDRCVSTGGRVESALCCETVLDFPYSCLVGGCGCAASSSHSVLTCVCPQAQCFVQELGCVSAKSCTPGQDQSCNENGAISSILGKCNPDRTCTCVAGSTLSPETGHCR
jgi:hypothetical protein